MTHAYKHAPASLGLFLLALALAGCGSTVSTSSFHGEEHEVAQVVANFQADVSAAEQQKVCANDLSSGLVARLGGPAACRKAVKNQLAEVDNLEMSVRAVQVSPPGAPRTATARVKSINGGKSRLATLTLVREGGSWKISGVQ
jgi:hypothetical protein